MFTDSVFAASPVLNFSDITNGLSSGLGDGLGEGAIVTVWGNNLGSTQGSSTITIGGIAPAHIYYWKNADGQLPGGPADLYKSHKMQEIAFSIPASLSDGSYDIRITVNGETSNGLPFLVRSTGAFYYVTPTGTGDGSYANPFSPFEFVTKIKTEKGITGYFKTGTYNQEYAGTSWNRIMLLSAIHSGTLGADNVFSSYPGEQPLFKTRESGITPDRGGFFADGGKKLVEYIIVSKLKFENRLDAIKADTNWRIIGNAIESILEHAVSGQIAVGRTQTVPVVLPLSHHVYIYGNELHGGRSQQTTDHAIYPTAGTFSLYVGWNYVHDNDFGNGVMFSINQNNAKEKLLASTDIQVHNNMIDVTTYPSRALGVYELNVGSYLYFYNNVIIGGAFEGSGSIYAASGNLYYYNNTLYQTGSNNMGTSFDFYCMDSAGSEGGVNYTNRYCPESITLKNNIIYSSTDARFYFKNRTTGDEEIIPIMFNNLWYGLGNFANKILGNSGVDMSIVDNQNPLFINENNNNFNLQSASPAHNGGISVTTVTRDMPGALRPQNLVYDIGAYEFLDGVPQAIIRADVDQNGTVNTTDAMLTLRNSLGLDMSSTNWKTSSTTGDVNCDGSSSTVDAMLILKKSLELNMNGTVWCE